LELPWPVKPAELPGAAANDLRLSCNHVFILSIMMEKDDFVGVF
jgi:hypothetical protein